MPGRRLDAARAEGSLGLGLRTPLGALAGSSAWLPRRGSEAPQQLVEGFLIHVMGLPASKVSDGPGIANQRWLACLQGHHRVVDPDRKEDGRAMLAFP